VGFKIKVNAADCFIFPLTDVMLVSSFGPLSTIKFFNAGGVTCSILLAFSTVIFNVAYSSLFICDGETERERLTWACVQMVINKQLHLNNIFCKNDFILLHSLPLK